MRQLASKVRPASGFANAFHLLFTVLLPILLFISVNRSLAQVAILLVVLSKWRMLAVRPRYWLANIRANAADITIGISTVIFMAQSGSWLWQLIWAVGYALWLVLIKPSSSMFGVSMQALITLIYGLMATFLAWGSSSVALLTFVVWLVCYIAANHFFSSFDEPHTRFLVNCWAFFGALLTWVLSHWLLYYGVLAQPTLLLIILGFGMSALYYLETTDRLSPLIRRQFIFVMLAIIIVVIVFGEWGDKTI